MVSSMLNGDRRWAPTRKGMTILGKVPKPINLPSQRLENHGLDPTVEIVPKGTLTWGSRPSPTSTNAWGLPNQSSPNADGGIDSLSGLNGRPSSSGSGTRPSTAGSDWSSERITSAWKSNSRPSSASGSLASNHTQLVARPQSAETRPGSSQLSRFADSGAGHLDPWEDGILQGSASSGTGDFVRSSGDFPTIGLEKNSGLHHEHESYKSSVTSASAFPEKDRLDISRPGIEKLDVHTGKGNADSWKSGTITNTGDASASIGSWRGNHPNMQLATNINTAESLSNPWHSHPRNPSGGVWYRGVLPGGPYRQASLGPSGIYQANPYHPAQIPVRLDPNSHSAPWAAGHPAGYENKNGEVRPHHPSETFTIPTMHIIPVQPGAYRGPVPYDGRYVSSAEYGGPNVRERPVVGFAPSPPVSGQFLSQPFHQGPFHVPVRPSGHTRLSNDKTENACQHEFATGQYKVLLKHHNHPVGTGSEGSRDQTTASKAFLLEKDGNEHGLRQKIILDESENSTTEETLRSSDLRGCSLEDIPPNSSEKLSESVVDDMIKKGFSLTASSEVKHPSTKNTKLIEKIETPNNKTWVADVRTEGPILTKGDSTKGTDDRKHYSLRNNVPPDSLSGGSSGIELSILKSNQSDESVMSSIIDISESRSIKAPPVPAQSHASTPVVSSLSECNNKAQAEYRKRTQNMPGKGNPLSKSTIEGNESNHWIKQVPINNSHVSPNNNIIRDELAPEEFSSSQDHGNRPGSLHMDKPRDESHVPSSLDSVDYKAQRAKMKEIALRRAKQLQQEEEERIREQKAKALAKLEELNRRTLFENSNKDAAGDFPNPDPCINHASGCNSSSSTKIGNENNLHGNTIHVEEIDNISGDVSNKNDGPALPDGSHSESATLKPKSGADVQNLKEPSLFPAVQLPDMNSTKQNESDTGKSKITDTLSLDSPKDTQYPGSIAASADQISARKNMHVDSFKKNNIQFRDDSSSSKRQVNHRRKQNFQEGRGLEEAAAPLVDIAGSETLMVVASETALGGKLTSTPSNETFDSSTQQRRNERNDNNKKESQYALRTDLPSAVQAKGILEKSVDIRHETILPISNTEKADTNRNISGSSGSFDQGLSQATGGSVKATNYGKSNHSRRPLRNGQSRSLDKFQGNQNVVWAPIRSSKAIIAAESPLNQFEAHVTAGNSSTTSAINDISNSKSRRAEIQRYVPKVVKDGPHEGNSQIPDRQIPVEAGFTKSDSATIISNAEKTQTNKNGKNNGPSASWRQRSSQDGPSDAVSSEMSSSGQKQLEGASSHIHAARSTDVTITQSDVSKEPLRISDPKEQGNTSKSRRQLQKVHKFVPADAKGSAREITGKFEVQHFASDWNAKSVTAESLNPVERGKSQWKPKSQTISVNNNQQNTGHAGEKASQSLEQNQDSSIIKDGHGMVPDENTLAKAANMDERRHQPIRERKDFAPENHNSMAGHNAEHYPGQPASSSEHQQYGMRHRKGKDVRHGGRLGKSHDNIYGDTRQNFPINGGRQRQISHYEYQRVEAHDSSNHFQAVASCMRGVPSGSTATGPRFREKAQRYKKGGAQFYVRSSESSRDDKPSDGQ